VEARFAPTPLYGTCRARIQLSGAPGGLGGVVQRLCPPAARAASPPDPLGRSGFPARASPAIPAAVNRAPVCGGYDGPDVHSPD
jgi:hypothetical protein